MAIYGKTKLLRIKGLGHGSGTEGGMVARKRLADEKGQLLIITALGLVMLLGVTALSIDASFMYDKRNHLFAAADAAAKSAAIEVHRYPDPSASVPPLVDLQRFADHQVHAHSFLPQRDGGTAIVEVYHPPISGLMIGNVNFVEVVVSEQTNTFFGKIFGRFFMTPGARAVAGTSGSPDCFVIMDHASFSNPATGSWIQMPNCTLVIGEAGGPTSPAVVDLYNNATITAKSVGVVHASGGAGCDTLGTGSGCTNVTYGVPPPTDPLIALDPLPNPGGATCTGPYSITADETISVGDIDKYYCGFNISNATLTFNPGLYYINGPLTDSGGATVGLSGTGVMLFMSAASRDPLTNASVNFDSSSNVVVDLTAPTSGTYNGILFYQDRSTPLGTLAVFGRNNTDLAIRGAMYLPTTIVQMNNENSPLLTNPCTLIVAWAIEVDKPHFQLDNACTVFGGSPILTVSISE
jgi:hypothetical protein